jgi:hypothetical protein
MGQRIACRILVGKSEGKSKLRKLRFRSLNNIKMDLREIGWGGIECIDLNQDRNQWRALVNK